MSRFTCLLVTALLYLWVDVGVCRIGDGGGFNHLTGENKPIGKYPTLTKGPNKTTSGNANLAPDKYITAGGYTGIYQYPWTVHYTVSFFQWTTVPTTSSCGGSLISSRHVLTAAHCLNFTNIPFTNVMIYLAEYNTANFGVDCMGTQCIQNVVMNPDQVVIHPEYQRCTSANDIALLRLNGQAPNNGNIQPIPLTSLDINAFYEATPLIVAGWGMTEHGQPSSIKKHAQVQLVAPQTCKKHYPVTAGMVCTAGWNGQDKCEGDSGGPLMLQQNGNFYLVGLVSFRMTHAPCGSGFPSMYTNVYPYLSWIQANTIN